MANGWCGQFEKGAILVPVEGEPWLLGGPESEPFAKQSSAIKNTRSFPVFMVPDEEYPNAEIIDFAKLNEELKANGTVIKRLSMYYECFKSICEKWEKGMELIHVIEDPSPDLRMIFDSAKACFLHSTSIKNQFEYICFTDKAIRRKALKSEQKMCEKMIELMGRNAAIGFEVSNHYYCTRYNLVEKIINCRYLEEKLFGGQNN